MKKLPDNVRAFSWTKSFTPKTVPRGLLKNHSTAEGVWALIRVESGELEYTIGEDEVHILSSDKYGVVEPTVIHHVRPINDTSFFVEFYK